PPPKSSEPYDDPAGGGGRARLVALRSTGGQTVVAPSVYPVEPAKGHPVPETIVWMADGEPTRLTTAELREAVAETAAAALVARHWKPGTRHNMARALAGGLLRDGTGEDGAARFIGAVCAAAR